LEALIDDRTSRIDNNADAIARLFDLITDKETRIETIDAAIERLETLIDERDGRIATNTARIAELGELIADKEGRIDVIEAAITRLTDAVADREARIETLTEAIDRLNGLIAEHEAELAALDPGSTRFATLTGLIETRLARVIELSERIDELMQLNAANALRIEELELRAGELAALITSHETRMAELAEINETQAGLSADHAARIVELTTRKDELAALILDHEERIDFLSERNILLSEQLARFEADLIEAQATCETVAVEGLFYLHADHLGRPQFATDVSGAVVWDMGEGVTPFGDSVNLAGAFAQRLMFPGQYADVETSDPENGDNVTLSHNWHRTYDPTLGRYLQSDPIGLAGGLNRYAYVGGNPLGAIDPDGQFWWTVGFAAADLAWQLYKNDGRWECVDWGRVGLSLVGGSTLKFFKTGSHMIKRSGSHTWGATKKWMARKGIKKINPDVQDRHHWLFQQNQGIGKYVPDIIKNQPWNINPVSKELNALLNNAKLPAWFGAPDWAFGAAGGGALMAFGTKGDECEC